jgi:hypothetical protein
MPSHSESKSAISHGQENAASNDSSQLDSAGQAILKLLHKAAGVAEANSRQALETAQKLSGQLHAAPKRIAELEGQQPASEHLLTIGRIHDLFASSISAYSMVAVREPALSHKRGQAKNGAASNRDYLSDSSSILASGILG